MSYSLQARALLIASLVLAAFLGGTGVVLDKAFRDSAEAAMRDGLEAYAETLQAAIENHHLDGLKVLPQSLMDKLAQPNSGLYAIVTRRSDHRRAWTSASAKDLDIPWPALAEFWTARLDPVQLSTGKSLYILSVNVAYQKPRSRTGVHYILQLAETLDDKESYYYSRVNQVRRRLWRWFGGTAVALLLLQALILRRSFAPLRRVEADLRAIVHASRYLDLDPPGTAHPFLAFALPAGRVDHLSLALAIRTGSDVDELAQERLLDPAHFARSVALRAAYRLGSRLGP